MEYGGAPLGPRIWRPAQWDYVALGHYHVAHEVAAERVVRGSLEYLPPNPWGQLQDEAERGRDGQGLSAGGPAGRARALPADRAGATPHRAASRSRGRTSPRSSSTRRSPRRCARRSRRSTARSCGCSCGTWPAPPRTISITRRSAATRRARCTSSSTCAAPKCATRWARRAGAPADAARDGARFPRRAACSMPTSRATSSCATGVEYVRAGRARRARAEPA